MSRRILARSNAFDDDVLNIANVFCIQFVDLHAAYDFGSQTKPKLQIICTSHLLAMLPHRKKQWHLVEEL